MKLSVHQSAVLVTGASSGIGRSVAVRLSRQNTLILHGRDRDKLEETRKLCSGTGHVIWSYDLMNTEGLRSSLSSVLQASHYHICGFVNSAGISFTRSVRLTELSDIDRVMRINFVAPYTIVSALTSKRINASVLRSAVFISSIWSAFGAAGHSVYSASKASLDGALKSLAVELAPSVRLNSIAAGAVRTPMSEAALDNEEIRSRLDATYPLGVGNTDSIAAVCEFLLSDAADWITGQVITVDGGRTSNMSY